MTTTKKTAKKNVSAKSKVAPMRSFKRSPEEPPFFSYRITHQTVYWLILSLLILALGIWVVTLSVKVQDLYDQIETTSSEVITTPDTKSY